MEVTSYKVHFSAIIVQALNEIYNFHTIASVEVCIVPVRKGQKLRIKMESAVKEIPLCESNEDILNSGAFL